LPQWRRRSQSISRIRDGLEVVLLWDRSSNRVKVAVSDERLCHHLDFEVARADALIAFYQRSRTQPHGLLPAQRRRALSDRGGDSMVTSDRTKWLALALLCAVQLMVVLDIAIVNVALPSIQVGLRFRRRTCSG
jgi:hypothetical protein